MYFTNQIFAPHLLYAFFDKLKNQIKCCYAAFHGDLHCLIRRKWSSQKEIKFQFGTLSIYTMDHHKFIYQIRRKNLVRQIFGHFSSPEPKAPRWAIRMPMTPSSIFKHLLWNNWANWTQIELKFHMETTWDSIFSNGPGHITKMLATPIYGKTFQNLLHNQKADDLGTWYVALGMWGLPSLFKWWS